MSQAEIAGGSVTPANEPPSKGRRLRDFELISTLGRQIRFSDYRGRSNLVLVFADDGTETTALLKSLTKQYAKIKDEEAEVLAVISASPQQAAEIDQRLRIPYPLLVDEDAHVHRDVCAVDQRGCAAAVYITDRFGEIFGLYRTSDRQSLPDVDEIMNWLEFINNQCLNASTPSGRPKKNH